MPKLRPTNFDVNVNEAGECGPSTPSQQDRTPSAHRLSQTADGAARASQQCWRIDRHRDQRLDQAVEQLTPLAGR